jgi:peptide/nickel transport system substrate-binding protein
MSTYDRLVSFGKKKQGENWVFDLENIRGELAERYVISPDAMKITFYLRKDAKFQDGTPVTAEDVKWSLDRAVSAKSLAAAQLLTGSMTKPEQFKVIDASTFEAQAGPAGPVEPGHRVPDHHQLEAGQVACHG